MATSSGSSTSFPTVVQTPQNAILDQIAGLAEQYAQQVYDWGSQVYEQTSQLTDQVIANFLQQSQVGSQFGQNAIDRYENLFQPQENQLIQDANTYSSQPRIMSEMGRAEAETAQGMNAARENTLKDLRQYGIEPSALEFAALDSERRTQAGAAGAAAGTEARRATENTGRQLRRDAIAVGQQYPGQAINDLNLSLQGLAGAQNAALGRANTGVALKGLPNAYLGTAMGLKLPPVGQTSSSQQSSNSPAPGGGGKSPKEDKKDPQQEQQQRGGGDRTINDIGQGGAGPGSGGSAFQQFDWGPSEPEDTGSAGFPDSWGGESYDPNNYGDPYGGYGTDSGSSYGDLSSYDPYNYDFGNYSDGSDASWGNYQYDQPDYSQFQEPAMPDWYDPNYGATDNSYDYSGYDYGSSGTNYGSSDSYGGDWGGGDWGDYAKGGPVRPGGQRGAPGGGRVPPSMSPSGGQRTDDIPAQINQTGGKARLNANEFVIPRDIVEWKGQEYFQKLIAQSRKARMGGPARPTTG